MGFLGKVGCTLSFHDWSDFRYHTDGSCQQVRYCKRHGCSKVDLRTDHSWDGWLPAKSNRCFETNVCGRCGAEEHRFNHLWSEWKYDAPQSCVQVRHCRRCEKGSERKEPVHNADHDVMPDDWKRVDCHNSSAHCRRCKWPLTMRGVIAIHRYPQGAGPSSRCLDCGAVRG